MNTIFYNLIEGTEKLAAVTTDLSISELVERGVFTLDTPYLILPEISEDTTTDTDLYAKFIHVDKTKFDNYINPTALLWDYDILNAWMLQEIRDAREIHFQHLDALQLQAMSKNSTSALQAIEADKQTLRDIPQNIDWSDVVTYEDCFEKGPEILGHRMREKYRGKI